MAAKAPVRVIFFDFGKTIVDFHLDFYFNWLERKFGISRHYFWSVFAGELLRKYERGEVSTEQFIAEFRTDSAKLLLSLRESEGRNISYSEFSDAEFIKAWNSVFDLQWNVRERFLLMRKLRGKGYKVHVLSNTNEAHMNYFRGQGLAAMTHAPFREVFGSCDRFIASCDPDVRARKTLFDGKNRDECETMFFRALEIANAIPEESVFVDDVQDFINTFKGMGGAGIVCRGNWTMVEHELHQLGVRWE